MSCHNLLPVVVGYRWLLLFLRHWQEINTRLLGEIRENWLHSMVVLVYQRVVFD